MSRLSSGRSKAGALLVAAALPVAVIVPLSAQASSNASAPAGGTARTAAVAAAHDRTSALEAKRVAAVPTPKLGWYRCYRTAECATVYLPLDYDQPKGAKVEVGLLRVKARNAKARIGSLFVNPGGPGGSGAELALAAPSVFGKTVLDRFDVVGIDPRGLGASSLVRCFKDSASQGKALAGLEVPLPVTAKERSAYAASAAALAKACSTRGRPLSASASTANVVRDMEVLRRAVGDKKLTYYGFSYGSKIGQDYSNMFPDRFRALGIDGVLDPLAWAGTTATAGIPVTERLRSAEGSKRALDEILKRCDAAGPTKCYLAGGAAAKYDLVAQRLKKQPVAVPDSEGGDPIVIDYASFVDSTVGILYSPQAGTILDEFVAGLLVLTDPQPAATTAARTAAKRFVSRQVGALRARAADRGYAFPYDNGLELFASVLCSETRNPSAVSAWGAAAARAERRTKYFGAYWTWGSAFCAESVWKAKDEDAYRGPFTRRTAAPVLVVGNYYDPATNYAGAQTTARLAPNSGLLTGDSWGHTAYDSSACLQNAVDRYLVTGRLPAKGLVCVGEDQPFTENLPEPEPDEKSGTSRTTMAAPGTSAARAAEAARSIRETPVAPVLPRRW